MGKPYPKVTVFGDGALGGNQGQMGSKGEGFEMGLAAL